MQTPAGRIRPIECLVEQRRCESGFACYLEVIMHAILRVPMKLHFVAGEHGGVRCGRGLALRILLRLTPITALTSTVNSRNAPEILARKHVCDIDMSSLTDVALQIHLSELRILRDL